MPARLALLLPFLLVSVATLISGCAPILTAVAVEGATQATRNATARAATAGPLCVVTDYGAVGDGQTLNTVALQRALDACAERGGGTVWVPAGTFISGPLRLRSRVALHLDAGAVLMGATGREAAPASGPSLRQPWGAVGAAIPGAAARGGEAPQEPAGPTTTLLYGEAVEDVTISGSGVIEGPVSFLQREDAPASDGWVRLAGVRGLTVRDVTFRNALGPTLVVERGERVLLEGMAIENARGGAAAHGVVFWGGRGATISNLRIEVGGQAVRLASLPGHAPTGVALRGLELIAPGGVQLGGTPAQPAEDLVVEGVRLRAGGGTGGEEPAFLTVAYVRGLRARDLHVRAAGSASDARPALFLEGVSNAVLDGVEAVSDVERPVALRITDVQGLTVRGARAEGFTTFLDGAGALRDLAVIASDLRRVQEPWRLPSGVSVRAEANLLPDVPQPVPAPAQTLTLPPLPDLPADADRTPSPPADDNQGDDEGGDWPSPPPGAGGR